MHDQSQLIAGIVALVFAVVIVRRTLRPQTVRVWSLIVVPVVLLLFALFAIGRTLPVTPLGIGIVIAGVLGGSALGYARGIHSRVKLGAQPGTVIVEGNGLLVAILLGAFALRVIVRASVGVDGPLALAVTDAFLLFAVLSVSVARVMLFFVWRRLSTSRVPSGVA